jgi:AraC-like DNA-binding protein
VTTNEPVLESPALALRCYGAVSASDVHEFHQIVLGLDGAMEMAVDGVLHRIDARHAWLIPAGSRHEYSGIGENRQLVLDLPCASLALPERFFTRARALTMNAALTSVVSEAASHAARIEAFSGAGGLALAASSNASGSASDNPAQTRAQSNAAPGARQAHRLAWDTATRFAAILGDVIGIETPSSRFDIERIDKWLRAHLSEPLRVTDLAAHCGLGERRFHQLFDEAFGTTPHRYLQRLRLDTALTLLGDARRTLIDVALTVGFADQSAFTHAFTRRFGLAPGQWRATRLH